MSHHAVFTYNVQCVGLAAGRRVVAEVVLSNVVFKTLTFHKVVWQHTWCVVGF